MAINPIDLQTMYSQINNVAKQTASQTQGAQLAQSMQQVNVVKKNTEQTQQVHKSDESSKFSEINSNGKNSQQENPKNEQKKELQEERTEIKKNIGVNEDYLGQHIDITR